VLFTQEVCANYQHMSTAASAVDISRSTWHIC